jgi:hypothetical protein
LAGAAARICMKICIACLHVGQMLFAGNKYLLLKRITVGSSFVCKYSQWKFLFFGVNKENGFL